MNPLAVSVELRCVFVLQGKSEKHSQAWMGLNYSWGEREREKKREREREMGAVKAFIFIFLPLAARSVVRFQRRGQSG